MSPNRRRVDTPALIFGVIFLAIATWWLVDRRFAPHLPHAGWIVAVLLIAVGVLGITNAIRGGDRGAGRSSGSRRDSTDA